MSFWSTVHFYRNVFSVAPKAKGKLAAKMLKAIHVKKCKKVHEHETSEDVQPGHLLRLTEFTGACKLFCA